MISLDKNLGKLTGLLYVHLGAYMELGNNFDGCMQVEVFDSNQIFDSGSKIGHI